MSFKNRWTISSSNDFQAHLQRSQRCRFSQTAVQWFEVLPGLSLALPGAPRLVVGAPRCSQASRRRSQACHWRSQTCRRCSQTCRQRSQACRQRSQTCHRRSQVLPNFSPALPDVLELITITPMVLPDQSSEIPVTLKAGRNPLLGSDNPLKLTHLSLHSTSSQTLLESSSD